MNFSIVFFLLVPVVVLVGCGKSSYRQQVLEDIQLRAQERLFRKAQVEFKQGRYAEASLQLEHFIAVHPESPLEEKARWLLARSYKQSGNLRAALNQYKIIAQGLPPGKDQQETLGRIAELEKKLRGATKQPSQVYAARISLNQLSAAGDVRASFNQLAQKGITTILLDLGCSAQHQDNRNVDGAVRSREVSSETLRHRLPSYVEQIHAQQMGVLIGLNLRCLGNWNPNSNVQWMDRFYDPTTQTVRASPYFDLFNPQYQEYLVQFLMKLAKSEANGIVFLAELPIGVYDGLTPYSAKQFQETFKIRLNPQTLFSNGTHGKAARSRSTQAKGDNDTLSPAPEFWRWVGWKTRHRLRVVQNLMTQVHKYHPELIFGLEVHSESIDNPLRALVHFSEDFLEANHKSFAFFLVSPQPRHSGRSDQISFYTKSFVDSARKLVARMVLVTNDPKKIWMTLPARMRDLRIRDATSGETRIPQGVARVYNLQTVP